MYATSREVPRLVIDEHAMAQALSVSVGFLRKDRITKRQIPFYKIGKSVRYDLETVRKCLAARQEGGAA